MARSHAVQEGIQSVLSLLPRPAAGQASILAWGDDLLGAKEVSILTDAREITSTSVGAAADGTGDEDDDDDDENEKVVGPLKWSDSVQFKNITMAVIMANSLCIAAEAWWIDNNILQIFFNVLEFGFTIAYCAEIRQRWNDHGIWGFFCNPSPFWNWFDFAITSLGVFSIVCDLFEGSSAIRIFRILRLARSLRIAKFMKDIEYVLLIAFRATAKLFGLTALVLFMFGILFTETLWNTPYDEVSDQFGNLSKSLWSLFVLMTLNDWVENSTPVTSRFPSMFAFIIAFIFIASIALLTLVPAMFVDQSVMSRELDAQERERIESAEQRLHDHTLLQTCFRLCDTNSNGILSLHEMKRFLYEKEVTNDLYTSGVARDRDVKDIILGLFDLVQHHEAEMDHAEIQLSKEAFVKGVFRQRDDKTGKATWRSTTSIRAQMSKFRSRMHRSIGHMDTKLDSLRELLETAKQKRLGPRGSLRPPIQTVPQPLPQSQPLPQQSANQPPAPMIEGRKRNTIRAPGELLDVPGLTVQKPDAFQPPRKNSLVV
jgi:voltage-gated sodium channel